MKIVNLLVILLLSAGIVAAQTARKTENSAATPIASLDVKGLFGSVRDGNWINSSDASHVLNQQSEFNFVDLSGISSDGFALGVVFEPEIPCMEHYGMTFDRQADMGVAVGANAEWELLPRVPKKLENDSKVYNEVVRKFLAGKGLKNPTIKITNAFLIDLDGDSTDEVVIAATSYANGVAPSAKAGDYSFVMVRKITGKKVDEIVIAGDFIKKAVKFGAPSAYDVSAIADLNGDGKMEVVVYGEYYEGSFAGIYEIVGAKSELRLDTGCGV